MMTNQFLVLVLCSIGVILIVRALLFFRKLILIKKWIPVDVNVTSARVKCVEQAEVYVKIERFIPIIHYTYEVEGVYFEGRDVSIDRNGWISNERKEVESLVTELSEKASAYYNPRDFSKSVLTRDVSKKRKSHYYATAFSGLLVLAVCFLL